MNAMNETIAWVAPEDEAAPAKRERSAEERATFEAYKLEKRLCRQVGQAIIDFNMIEEGDRIMVCMSGGKDSYGMLDILLKMQQTKILFRWMFRPPCLTLKKLNFQLNKQKL